MIATSRMAEPAGPHRADDLARRPISSLVHGADRVVASLGSCATLLSGAQRGRGTDDAHLRRARRLLASGWGELAGCMGEMQALADSGALHQLPLVRHHDGHRQLRVHQAAGLLAQRGDAAGAEGLVRALRGEIARGLSLREVSLIPAMLRFTAVERLADAWTGSCSELRLAATADELASIERSWRTEAAALVNELAMDALAEAALRSDPAGVYAGCDPATRDRYRSAVEQLAAWSSRTQSDVAQRAADLARQASEAGAGECAAHVGHYLVGEGRARLEERIQARVPGLVRLGRRLRSRAVGLYLAVQSSLAVVLIIALLLLQSAQGSALWSLVILAGLPAFVAFWQIAQLVTDTLYSLTPARAPLPRMDFGRGVPERFDTLVAVPCLIRGKGEVNYLVRVLQEHAASTLGLELRFCLLSDFGDAPAEVMPGDDELLSYARSRIDVLNGADRESPRRRFLLLHRPRRWNPSEGVWMGHERKRGKLCDFNAVILGAEPTAFVPSGDAALVRGVAFVIALDVDNRLAHGSALRLVETMAHPLVRAHVRAGGPTRQGYGVLQPRICARPLGDVVSHHERWGSDDLGTDETPGKLNHLHQDLFGEASFFGKGIYDVAAFAGSTGGRFGENTVLSHDLLEGCYARTAMVADACLMEDSPADYAAEARRRHRWMRGDWQNLLWMMRRRRVVASEPAGEPALPLLSRWKIVNNVRRNMVSVTAIWLLVLGLLAAPDPARWIACVLSVVALPRASAFVWEWRKLWQRVIARRIPVAEFAADSAQLAWHSALRTALGVAVLPFEAFMAVDAAVRSGWRLLVSGRRLLEWVPFHSDAPPAAAATPASYVAMMRGQLVATVALSLLLGLVRPEALMTAAPLILAWLSAPALAWSVGRPREIARRASVAETVLRQARPPTGR